MQKTFATITAAALLACTPAFAQSTAPSAPKATPPAGSAQTGSTQMSAAAESKFKAADKDNNGSLAGAELDAYKANLAKIDKNNDGRVSRDEFASAMASGVIK